MHVSWKTKITYMENLEIVRSGSVTWPLGVAGDFSGVTGLNSPVAVLNTSMWDQFFAFDPSCKNTIIIWPPTNTHAIL